jgi:hypothetical protein
VQLYSFRPKVKIAVVPVTRPTFRFAPKKTDSNYFILGLIKGRVVCGLSVIHAPKRPILIIPKE